ncbi:MAG: ABC transporter substrate-binding protein [Actinomycetota bacterium]
MGPFSNFNALTAVPEFVNAGVAACSPSASLSTLDHLDDGGLFIRTATQESDVLARMVDMAVQSGNEEVSLTYPDDPYGRTLAREMKKNLSTRGLTVVTEVSYSTGADDYRSVAFRLTSDAAQVEMLITDPANGPRLLEALIPEAEGSVIITNDGTIGSDVVFDPAVPEKSRPRVFGAAPDTRLGSNTILDVFSFTTVEYLTQLTAIPDFTINMVDCFALIWLTALTAASDDATVFQEEFVNVSNDGSRCSWLFDCSFLFDRTLNLDYEGVTSLTLDELGNAVNRGTVIFTFDSDGRAMVVEGPLDFTLTASDFDPFAPPS